MAAAAGSSRAAARMAMFNSTMGYLSYAYMGYQVFKFVREVYKRFVPQGAPQGPNLELLVVTRPNGRRPPNPPNPSSNNQQHNTDSNDTVDTVELDQPEDAAHDDDEEHLSSVSTISIESDVDSSATYDDQQCFICCYDLHDARGLPVASLPTCMHTFHKTCIEAVVQWFKKCPVCHEPIFSAI